MKKTILIIVSDVFLALIISLIAYFYIWGGKPYVENFAENSDDYETIVHLALNTYSELPSKEEYIIIDIYDGNFKYNNLSLPLTETQQSAVRIAGKKFDYLRVCENAVFFCEDETGYYGLVYSKHPLAALYKAELPQDGREYHRINSHWYEWGVGDR